MGTAGQPASSVSRPGPWLLRPRVAVRAGSAGAAAGASWLCSCASGHREQPRGQLRSRRAPQRGIDYGFVARLQPRLRQWPAAAAPGLCPSRCSSA
eukprot:2767636-Alexandrium_andersonii.AAC.1